MNDPLALPRVASGHVTALRLLDVAYEIDLPRAETLWTAHATQRDSGRAARARLSSPPKAVAFGVPPVAIPLPPETLSLGGHLVEAAVVARLYEFGALSLSLRVAADDLAWDAFADLLNAVGRAVAGETPWRALLDTLRAVIGPALIRPSTALLEEDYLTATVTNWDVPLTTADLLARVDLTPLLTGETRRLSDASRADLIRQRFSYYNDDLVVLTWDRAFLVEPRGETDVADVLEVANAQLLELRTYDELLDDELPRMYDLVEGARRGRRVFSARRYAGLARRLHTLVAEVTELTERIDNALQVTEDVYLARVYAAALDLMRVPAVGAAVDRKLAIIRETYTALYDEASGSRSELLEIAVVLLIVTELLLALIRH